MADEGKSPEKRDTSLATAWIAGGCAVVVAVIGAIAAIYKPGDKVAEKTASSATQPAEELIAILNLRYDRMILKMFDDVDLGEDSKKKFVELGELHQKTVAALKGGRYVEAHEYIDAINDLAKSVGYKEDYIENPREKLKYIYPGFPPPIKGIPAKSRAIFLPNRGDSDEAGNFEKLSNTQLLGADKQKLDDIRNVVRSR